MRNFILAKIWLLLAVLAPNLWANDYSKEQLESYLRAGGNPAK